MLCKYWLVSTNYVHYTLKQRDHSLQWLKYATKLQVWTSFQNTCNQLYSKPPHTWQYIMMNSYRGFKTMHLPSPPPNHFDFAFWIFSLLQNSITRPTPLIDPPSLSRHSTCPLPLYTKLSKNAAALLILCFLVELHKKYLQNDLKFW